jgi:hypothetical protein
VKAVIGIISGFVVSLFMFAGGAGIAAYLLAVEPVPDQRPSQDTADLWSAEPRRIDTQQQEFVRTASIAPEGSAADLSTTTSGYPVEDDTAEQANTEPMDVDPMQTGSAEPLEEMEVVALEEADMDRPSRQEIMGPLLVAHLNWCRDQYRSYRPETNTYRAYQGGQQECVSPYMQDIQAAAMLEEQDYAASTPVESAEPRDASSVIYYAANDRQPSMSVDSDHMRDCARRYRSYRFEDNTYQPYGGGPRRQCM